jgi:hypothetical protein
MKYTIEIQSGGIMYIPSVMKIGTSFDRILRFCLSSLKGSKIGNTDGRDL